MWPMRAVLATEARPRTTFHRPKHSVDHPLPINLQYSINNEHIIKIIIINDFNDVIIIIIIIIKMIIEIMIVIMKIVILKMIIIKLLILIDNNKSKKNVP